MWFTSGVSCCLLQMGALVWGDREDDEDGVDVKKKEREWV